NLRNGDDTIDVHGLFVREAIKKVETSLHAAIRNGRKELHVIVGRGLHSRGGVAKLRVEIPKEMERQEGPNSSTHS
ncbi:hypothetical protein B0H16DRAFT_1297975, partial [Mycena metata]